MGDWRALCLLFYELCLYLGFLWCRALFIVNGSSVIPMLAHATGADALEPGSSGLSSI